MKFKNSEVQMIHDDIKKDLNRISDLMNKKYNRFTIFCTHSWEQSNGHPNIVIYSKDKRWSHEEFCGAIIDIVATYMEQNGMPMQDNLYVRAIASVLKKMDKKGYDYDD